MIREEQEPDLDLDWFALDPEGYVGHFTTGGCGALPLSIASASDVDLRAVRDHFLSLPEVGRALFNPAWAGLRRLFPGPGTEPGEVFRPWLQSAARGLYSFDYIEDQRRRPRPYRVVARPEVPLKADELPPAIRSILERTVLRGVAFPRHDVIGMASLL